MWPIRRSSPGEVRRSSGRHSIGPHPPIIRRQLNIDVASYNVKVLEGEMLPTASSRGNTPTATI